MHACVFFQRIIFDRFYNQKHIKNQMRVIFIVFFLNQIVTLFAFYNDFSLGLKRSSIGSQDNRNEKFSAINNSEFKHLKQQKLVNSLYQSLNKSYDPVIKQKKEKKAQIITEPLGLNNILTLTDQKQKVSEQYNKLKKEIEQKNLQKSQQKSRRVLTFQSKVSANQTNCSLSNCKQCTQYQQALYQFDLQYTADTQNNQIFTYQFCDVCQDSYYLYRQSKVIALLNKTLSSQNNKNITQLSRLINSQIEPFETCILSNQKVYQSTIQISGIFYELYLKNPKKFKTWLVKVMGKYQLSYQQLKVAFVTSGSIIMDYWFKKPKDFAPNGDVTDDIYDPSKLKQIGGTSVTSFNIEQIMKKDQIALPIIPHIIPTDNNTINSNATNNSTINNITTNDNATNNSETNNNTTNNNVINEQTPSRLKNLLPIIISGVLGFLILGISAFYMLVIRPRRKLRKEKEKQEKKLPMKKENEQMNIEENMIGKDSKGISSFSTKTTLEDRLATPNFENNPSSISHEKQKSSKQISTKEERFKNKVKQSKVDGLNENVTKEETQKNGSIVQRAIQYFGRKQRSKQKRVSFASKVQEFLMKPSSILSNVSKSEVMGDQIQSMEQLGRSQIQSNKPLSVVDKLM